MESYYNEAGIKEYDGFTEMVLQEGYLRDTEQGYNKFCYVKDDEQHYTFDGVTFTKIDPK